jgi:glucans biosynthesis protein
VKKLPMPILWLTLFLMLQPHSAFSKTREVPFGLQYVVDQARILAGKPFQEPQKVPEFLRKIDYDQWRDIRFRPEKALWLKEKLPFQVQFFHPGFLYDQSVRFNVVEGKKFEQINFSPDLFSYGLNDFKDKVPPDLGFAGFRLHYPINSRTYYDEVAVFLGASYFRAVGKGIRYGLSARALAINTAVPSGEEFPFFKEFWLQRPTPSARQISVYALIDSPSATGAYRFVIRPGKATVIEVTATVFLRKGVQKLGIAPLTSMFFYGENTNLRIVDDFRPEVHDSDGLLIATGTGEWIWRPLENPPSLLDTSFQLNNPKGFGLLQRDRDFDHYQDLEADFQLRPSVWVTPTDDMAKGQVELVQIPMKSETNDNIVSFWVPHKLPDPLQPLTFSYSLRWFAHSPLSPAGYVAATRTAKGEMDQARRFLVDFAGGKLESLEKEAKVEALVSVGGGKVIEQHLEKNAVSGGWRLSFEVLPDQTGPLDQVLPDKMKKPLELRALLRQGNEVLTETWSYVVYP